MTSSWVTLTKALELLCLERAEDLSLANVERLILEASSEDPNSLTAWPFWEAYHHIKDYLERSGTCDRYKPFGNNFKNSHISVTPIPPQNIRKVIKTEEPSNNSKGKTYRLWNGVLMLDNETLTSPSGSNNSRYRKQGG